MVVYCVVESDEKRTRFDTMQEAFAYANHVGSKEILKKIPDQDGWYYWNWQLKAWVYQ